MGLATYECVLRELKEVFSLKEVIAEYLIEKHKTQLIVTDELNANSLADFTLADKIVREEYQDAPIPREHLEL